ASSARPSARICRPASSAPSSCSRRASWTASSTASRCARRSRACSSSCGAARAASRPAAGARRIRSTTRAWTADPGRPRDAVTASAFTLQRRLEALYGLERRRDKLGLDGTRALLGALGDPQRRFRAVHVAGTNGKGSACAVIERVLREAGLRTGLFTSPHLVDFRERIRVDGRWADAAWLDEALDRIAALPEGRD